MLQLRRTNSENPDFITLIKLLDEDLALRYNNNVHNYYIQFNKVDYINHVIVVYQGGEAIGCGAIKKYDEQTMEIKRMFVKPNNRGKGAASKILSELEKWSLELGYKKCILETGNKQTEAIAFYGKMGYSVIPNYDQYAGLDTSVCFSKSLTDLGPLVSVDWLIEHKNDKNLIILDASLESKASQVKTEIQGLQIPGARYFDTKNTFSIKKGEVPNMIPSPDVFAEECGKLGISNKSKIVVYDNLGIYNSPRVWWMFKVMGHNNVAVLDGGLPAWSETGQDTEQTSRYIYKPVKYSANFQPNLVKDVDQILQNIENNNAEILDARSKGRYNATSPEPREGLRGGHIPKSVCFPYTEVLKNGKYKKIEELELIFRNLDLSNKPMYFTCGSGVTACIILLAVDLVSNAPKSLYDGSWTEWGGRPDLPIEV